MARPPTIAMELAPLATAPPVGTVAGEVAEPPALEVREVEVTRVTWVVAPPVPTAEVDRLPMGMVMEVDELVVGIVVDERVGLVVVTEASSVLEVAADEEVLAVVVAGDDDDEAEDEPSAAEMVKGFDHWYVSLFEARAILMP